MIGVPSINGLRHRITLQNRSTVKDGFGQELTQWADVATCFAQIEPVSGASQTAGEAVSAPVKYVIFIRYRAGVSARMRVLYGSRRLEIDSVMNVDERIRWLQLDCTQGLTAG